MTRSAEVAAAPVPGAGVREWAGLAVLTLPVLLVSMDMTVLHLAIPEITGTSRRPFRPARTASAPPGSP